MPKETSPSKSLIVRPPELPEKPKKPSTTRLQPLAILRALAERLHKAPSTEILLNNEEMCTRVKLLYDKVKADGERTIRREKNTYCRIFINPNNDALEMRIGKKQNVEAVGFQGIKELETIVQITFLPDGQVFTAVLGDLEKQATYSLGPAEYNMYGTVYGRVEYHKSVGAIATFTEAGPLSIPYTDEMKQSALQAIFEPINGIVWNQTLS